MQFCPRGPSLGKTYLEPLSCSLGTTGVKCLGREHLDHSGRETGLTFGARDKHLKGENHFVSEAVFYLFKENP